jgi:two-component system, LytTR family, sensor kinase
MFLCYHKPIKGDVMKKIVFYAIAVWVISITLTSCVVSNRGPENDKWDFFKQVVFRFDIDTVKTYVVPARKWKPVEVITISGNYAEADFLYISNLLTEINAINKQTCFVLEKVADDSERMVGFKFINRDDCPKQKYFPLNLVPDADKRACIIMHRSLDTYYSKHSSRSQLTYYTDRRQILIIPENIPSSNLKKQVIRRAFLSYLGLGDYNYRFNKLNDMWLFNRNNKEDRIFGKQNEGVFFEYYTPKMIDGFGYSYNSHSYDLRDYQWDWDGNGNFSASVFNFADTSYRKFTEDDKYIIRTYLSPILENEIVLHKTGFYKKLDQKLIDKQILFNISISILLFVLSVLFVTGGFNRSVFLHIDKITKNSWLAFNLKVTFVLTIIISWIFVELVLFKINFSYDPYYIRFFVTVVPIYFIYTFIPLNILFLIERQIFPRIHQFFKQQLSSSILTIGTMVFCTWFIDLLHLSPMHAGNYFVAFAVGTGISLARFTLKYLDYKNQLALQESEQKLVQLRELKTRAELNALQSKINPHFLYNALNSIAGLAHADADKVEQMALALSKLFRYSVNKEDDDFTMVQNEVEMASIYLDIEKVRFGNKLQYQVKVVDEVQKERIPKFVIQPLVENAIKHGISKITTEGILTLTIFRDSTGLHMVVGDNGPDFPEDIMTGYGLQSIYEKLDILYPGRYEITMQNGTGKNISLTLK